MSSVLSPIQKLGAALTTRLERLDSGDGLRRKLYLFS